MKYKKSERVQSEVYSSIEDLISDVIETVLDEDNYERSANIVSDRKTIENILDYIDKSSLDFEFNVNIIDFRDNTDEYILTILDDGELFVEPVIDKNGKYYDLDGFLFVDKCMGSDVYKGKNRRCDTMLFDLLS